MITINNINKYFNRRKKNEIHVINNTSLEFDNTGLVALLGPSGSGKTTLLNVIGGLDKVNSGNIFINGKKMTRFSTSKIDEIRNLNIGYIFQNYNLIDDLSVFDNVAITLKMIGIKDSEEIKNRVNYVLRALGIYKYRNRLCSMLSGGEMQRVAIARAIVKNPSIIIADEPTGNLDSKNTIEIMNIIKSISKTKLVILVTHEKELAYFYASRIIELKDGKIIGDKINKHDNDLDYKIDNKIYLKDIKNHNKIFSNNLNIDYYNDENDKLNIKIVVKRGNIYVECDSKKIEVIDEDSSIELVNDTYNRISKDEYENYNFDFDQVINNNYKLKYTSIFNIFSLIKNGFKKIKGYSFLRKISLVGFFISAMFVVYSVCNIAGILNIKDEDFVSQNKNYLTIMSKNISRDEFDKYESMDNINYILPSDSKVIFMVPYSDYYQTSQLIDHLSGSLSSLNMISDKDLIYGRMAKSKEEVVVDKLAIERMFKRKMAKSAGVLKYSDMVGRIVTISNMKEFKIVGITDLKSNSIYVDDGNFINILANYKDNGGYFDYNEMIPTYDGEKFADYELFKDQITLKRGEYPVNDYEVIVNYRYSDLYQIGKSIDKKVNNVKLKVVGYYDSLYTEKLLTNNNTIKYSMLDNSSNLTIYSKNKEETISYFKSNGIYIIDTYEKEKSDYINMKRESMTTSIIIASIVLLISLVEIYLIIRASFLSRIKEVGILRAIGVKKIDIYKMFLGEIIDITLMLSVPGFIFMNYILKSLIDSNVLTLNFNINSFTMIASLILIVLFNTLFGLLPVFGVIRKTPQSILSRIDVD